MGTAIFTKFPKDCDFGGKKVLNVGCGFSRYTDPNVINLDGEDICKPDVVWDLNKTPLPFEDETFDMVIANHILEHLVNWWACFNELARIVKTGGQVIVYVPGSGSDSQLGYRDHVHTINDCSFFGVLGTRRNLGNAWAQTEIEQNLPCARMNLIEKDMVIISHWWMKCAPQRLQKFFIQHLRNVILEEGFFFRKI